VARVGRRGWQVEVEEEVVGCLLSGGSTPAAVDRFDLVLACGAPVQLLMDHSNLDLEVPRPPVLDIAGDGYLEALGHRLDWACQQ